MGVRSCGCRMLLLAAVAYPLELSATPDANMMPFTPFKIVGSLYYVGSEDQSSFLVATANGLILINSGFEASAPLIEQSIEKLGFKVNDIKIVLIGHAHIDHDGGSAAIIRDSGAKYEVMDADVPVVESGGKLDFNNGQFPAEWYPVAHVDRTLHDGDKVELGGTVLTAVLTPGHTKGNTTWTFDEKDDEGRVLHVVVVGSTSAAGGAGGSYRLVDNATYPGIVKDFEKSFAVLPTLPCDVFLGAHARYFNMQAKYERLTAGDKNAFVDPSGYKLFVANGEKNFKQNLAKQIAAKQSSE